MSFSAGYTHFDTEGFRVNNDQKDDIANVFAQWEVTPNTSIQAEYRYRKNDRGDTQLRFFEDDFRPDDSRPAVAASGRPPSSVLIGNFAYQKLEDDFFDFGFIDPAAVGVPLPPPPPFIYNSLGLNGKQDGYTGELLHLFRSQYVNTAAGAGYFYIDQDLTQQSIATYPGNPDFGIPPITFVDDTTKTESDIDHVNLYLYSYIKPMKNLTLIVGASGDFFKYDEDVVMKMISMKTSSTPNSALSGICCPCYTARCRIRTFKRTLITDQTLEPPRWPASISSVTTLTTEAWVYGLASIRNSLEHFRGSGIYQERP
jgi:hypothetical protein